MTVAAARPLITVGDGPKNAQTDPTTGLRYYTWQGKRYPSVTTIRRLAGLPHGLHQWAINQVINRVLDEAPSIALRLGTGDPAQVALTRHYLREAATEQRDKAAALGTAVHAAAAEGKALTEVGSDIAPHLRQYIDWREKSGVEVLASEFQVWNPTVGYAGTCDLLGRFPDGSTWVIDIKTGKGTYGEHALQLMAYLMGEFVGADDVVDEGLSRELGLARGIAVLHLAADGWQFYSLDASPDVWNAFRGLLTFGVWMAAHGPIESVILGSRKGAA
jgi:hypothetical protein